MKTIVATLEGTKDGYGVWFDELPNVFLLGEAVEQAKTNASEAIKFSFEGVTNPPKWGEEGFDIAVRFDTAGLLSHYQDIFTKRALFKITGINESLWSQCAMRIKNHLMETHFLLFTFFLALFKNLRPPKR